MQFNSKLIALFSVLASTVAASDVYSMFLDSTGAEIGSTNFDIANDGCFSVPGAIDISFSQSGPAHEADGPYCLTGYSEGGCVGDAATQQFANVQLGGQTYQLNQGLAYVGSYKWSAEGC